MEKMIDISDENIRLHTLCKENEETYLYLQKELHTQYFILR